jgi:hypothetical protein
MHSSHERLFRESTPTDAPHPGLLGEAAGTPPPAEIFVYPIFIRALAQTLRLSYGEELRRVLTHALLRPLGYRGDMSKARLRMRLAKERWLALWNALSCVSHETFRVWRCRSCWQTRRQLPAYRGCRVLLIIMGTTEIGQVSCNPATGGVVKGQLVRKIDALGRAFGYRYG